MANKTVVFESPKLWHKWLIMMHQLLGRKVFVIEPFHAYHYDEKGRARFFPRPIPDYIWELNKSGRIALLEADQINKRDIYLCAADLAVSIVEDIFQTYKKHNLKIVEHVSKTLNSQKADEIFKKYLCDQMGRYYSMNIMMQRIGQIFDGKFMIYPASNVFSYLYIEKLLVLNNQKVFGHRSIVFPFSIYLVSLADNAVKYLKAILRLKLQAIASIIAIAHKNSGIKTKKHFRYAVTILSGRQLRNNNRRADYFVDGNQIKSEEVVYIPLIKLSSEQAWHAQMLNGEVYYPPNAKRNFSHHSSWLKLLWSVLTERAMRNADEVNEACRALAEYYRWKKLLDRIEFKHFITHSDFGSVHIARNLALSQAGVETWYLIDSMNNLNNFGDAMKGLGMLHPFWAYLNYDHFVSWHEFDNIYHSNHHSSFGKMHLVGCLWAGHNKYKEKRPGEGFNIAAFDSTYTNNSYTSYVEGIEFARHLLTLVKECQDIVLHFKEKKADDKAFHAMLDPVNSPALLSLYKKMYQHPRVKKYSNQADVAEIMAEADFVVSFPFTSTTFEALAAKKPAIWHDPLGYYRDTLYARAGGVTTHSYGELKRKVLEVMDAKGMIADPLPNGSPLMDPYKDGRAVERFRRLLVDSN